VQKLGKLEGEFFDAFDVFGTGNHSASLCSLVLESQNKTYTLEPGITASLSSRHAIYRCKKGWIAEVDAGRPKS
jgi:hypothetical protein